MSLEDRISRLCRQHLSVAQETLKAAREANLPARETLELFKQIERKGGMSADVHLSFLTPAIEAAVEKIGSPEKSAEFLLSAIEIGIETTYVIADLLKAGLKPDKILLLFVKVRANSQGKPQFSSLGTAVRGGAKLGVNPELIQRYVDKTISQAEEEYEVALEAFGRIFGNLPARDNFFFDILAAEYVNLCGRFNGQLNIVLGPVVRLRGFFKIFEDDPERLFRHFQLHLQALRVPGIKPQILEQLMLAVIDGEISITLDDNEVDRIVRYLQVQKSFQGPGYLKYKRKSLS